MSSVYVSEPPTKGKVIMTTTYGPLDIELWPKEAPKAVRNFVQLCLEGYFDNTIFHRVIPGFLVQGGDPTGSGTGGESVYGSAFSDEFHSRLRFTHRGLVACANAGSPNSNGSQFFITLDKCDWLDKQNTIFGKVTGDSIFNLLELGKVETDKNDRPLEPIPVVKSVEVLWNPFEDIVPRILTKPSAAETEQKSAKQKVVKNLNLLSFGEEAEEEEKVLSKVHHKIKSSHDVLNDPRLLKEDTNEADPKATRDLQLSVREALSSKKVEPNKNEVVDDEDDTDNDNDDEETFDNKMRKKIIEKQKKLGGSIPSLKEKADKDTEVDSDSESEEESKGKVEKLSLKKKGIGSEARAERMINADVDLQLYGEAERTRLLHKQKKRRLQGREEDVLAKLENFRKNLTHLPAPAPAPVSDSGENEDVSDWTASGLVFSREVGKDAMARREAADDYVVHDPLLEKGKEKFNKMQAKQKRRQREWAGRSLT